MINHKRFKKWRETIIIGQQSFETKQKPREWVTLYQSHGVALQVNPTYYEFRLWIFTSHGNAGVDLDEEKARKIVAALSIHRLLISNVPSHGGAWQLHSRTKWQPRFTKGERAYTTRQVNRYITGQRVHKRLNKTQTQSSV